MESSIAVFPSWRTAFELLPTFLAAHGGMSVRAQLCAMGSGIHGRIISSCTLCQHGHHGSDARARCCWSLAGQRPATTAEHCLKHLPVGVFGSCKCQLKHNGFHKTV